MAPTVTFKDVFKGIDGGARFYTADLHVHSFGASSCVKDSTMTPEAVIDAAVQEGISIVALTDHNNDANLIPVLQYSKKFVGSLLVLPGAEISTANGHLLVYARPETPDVIGTLLTRVELIGTRGAEKTHTAKSMADVVGLAESLGAVCVAAHIDRDKSGFDNLISGYPSSKEDIICASGLYGLEFDDVNHLLWYSPSDDQADADGAERLKLLECRRTRLSRAHSRLAAVQNSDAHDLEEFIGHARQGRLTRYKMDELTFDGLRVALLDSEARVRAIATVPVKVPRVLGMYVRGGFLDGETYRFSNNLNCFIGGRGTGKSTALRSLAYALGVNNDFANHDNCPDLVLAYCEDANGVVYRYERTRGGQPNVRAREEGQIQDGVPADAFRIEFYDQGHLAKVAEDPLRDPQGLQDFLDRHLVLDDLFDRERLLVEEIVLNGTELIPLENGATQLAAKQEALKAVNAKLKVAETGHLKELATQQSQVAAEKSLCDSLEKVAAFYSTGFTLANGHRDYQELANAAGTLTGDERAATCFENAKTAIGDANAFLATQEKTLNDGLKVAAGALRDAIKPIVGIHEDTQEAINIALADLASKGLSGSVKELNTLIATRTQLAGEIVKLSAQAKRLNDERNKRTNLLADLEKVRSEIARRRRDQLAGINESLRRTIEDYVVVVHYAPAGVIGDFRQLVLGVMQGTYLPEGVATTLCRAMTPLGLARLVRVRNVAAIASQGGVSAAWAQQIVNKFAFLHDLHRLEVTSKPPSPTIKVVTKGLPPTEIRVNELSDGQKHTILLTIAMLAESEVPLVIDQPEDDLDNAFISSTVVRTLRAVKERRQVILVTHNANVAVLGDSELILPMTRKGDCGRVVERGSIDGQRTKEAVQDILEGGAQAFRRRMEIYGVQ